MAKNKPRRRATAAERREAKALAEKERLQREQDRIDAERYRALQADRGPANQPAAPAADTPPTTEAQQVLRHAQKLTEHLGAVCGRVDTLRDKLCGVRPDGAGSGTQVPKPSAIFHLIDVELDILGAQINNLHERMNEIEKVV